jgi:hypothetical protein
MAYFFMVMKKPTSDFFENAKKLSLQYTPKAKRDAGPNCDGKFCHPHRTSCPIYVDDGFFRSVYVSDGIFHHHGSGLRFA